MIPEERYKVPMEQVTEIRKQLEHSYQASDWCRRGHFYFQFNFDTGELTRVIFKPEDTKTIAVPPQLGNSSNLGEPKSTIIKRHSVQKDPNSLYFSALNFDNAIKKLKKLIPSIEFEKTS